MYAFQVLTALIAGASAAAIHDETAQAWDIAENTSAMKDVSPEDLVWKKLETARGDVTWFDPYIGRSIKLNCRTASDGGEVCCRTEPELMPLDDSTRFGADLCERMAHKRHHFGDVKRKGDYSATYIGEHHKSPKKLLFADCQQAMATIKTDCAATVIGANGGHSANMTYGGFYKDKKANWAFTANIPLDGKTQA